MKLYISDLDGTLLNQAAEISRYTETHLNKMIDHGLAFTVATARTAATVKSLLKNIHIRLPVILMNGVCILDLQKDQYLSAAYIEQDARHRLVEIVRQFGLEGFYYTIENNKLQTLYEKATSMQAKSFMEERVIKFGKVFTQIIDAGICCDSGLVYYSISGQEDRLKSAWHAFQADARFNTEYYRDIYNHHHWYLEVSASSASKYKAACYLKDSLGAGELISFGDNLNDLPLFEASTYSCAVENAKDDVKQAASTVIGSYEADGVVNWLMKHADR